MLTGENRIPAGCELILIVDPQMLVHCYGLSLHSEKVVRMNAFYELFVIYILTYHMVQGITTGSSFV